MAAQGVLRIDERNHRVGSPGHQSQGRLRQSFLAEARATPLRLDEGDGILLRTARHADAAAKLQRAPRRVTAQGAALQPEPGS